MSTVDASLVIDNRINVSSTYTQLVPTSGQQVNYFEVNADGNSFPSQIYFNNIVTPGGLSSTLVGRNVRLRYTLTVSTPSNAGVPIGLAQVPYTSASAVTAALRAFPLQSVCDTLSAQINGATTTISSRQILSAVQRFMGKDLLDHVATECPSMPDNRALLVSDQVSSTIVGTASPIIAVSNQPLSKYENSLGATRGSFLPTSYVVANNVATWTFDVSEPLMVSPFVLYENDVFLGQLNTMSIQLNFSSLQDMLVSSTIYDAPTIAISNPRLQLTYIQIQPGVTSIPPALKYDYQNVVYFPKSQSVTAGTAFTPTVFQTDTLRLTTMPKMIYVFMRNPIQNRFGQTAADCFYGIGGSSGAPAGVSLSIGVRTGLLASASAKTLWKMAVGNGYNGSWENWSYGQGSILAIDPVKDLGINLATDSVPGEASGNVNLQLSVQFNCQPFIYAGSTGQIANNPELMVLAIYSGDVTISADTALFNLGSLTEAEVKAVFSKGDASMVNSELVAPTVAKGAGLFAKGKSIVGHGIKR
jgi:hypothetical protein